MPTLSPSSCAQEGVDLPRVLLEDETTVLELLTAQRESARAEANRLRNQIHALLLQVDPEYKFHLPAVNSKAGLEALRDCAPTLANPLQAEHARVIRHLAERLALALLHEEELAVEIREVVKVRFAPLTKLCGINLLTAGRLASILGPGNRFASDAQLAAHGGVGPLRRHPPGRSDIVRTVVAIAG